MCRGVFPAGPESVADHGRSPKVFEALDSAGVSVGQAISMALCERPGSIHDPVFRGRDNGVISAGRVIPRSAASPLGCGSFDASVSNAFRMTSGLEVRAAVLDGAGLGGLLFLSDSCLRGILAHVGRGHGAGSSLFLSSFNAGPDAAFILPAGGSMQRARRSPAPHFD